MADQPYIKWWTSDFLTGVIDLSAEETGVYAILLTMMADRGGPVPCASPDDRQWLARRCNLTTRAFNRALARLTDLGKLQERNGLLGNRRMLAEILDRDKKSKQASDAAHARWAKWADENPPSLPFDTNFGNTGDLPAEKQAEKSQKNRAKKPAKPRNSAIPAENPHQSPSRRARARPEPESESTLTHPKESDSSRDAEAGRDGTGDSKDEGEKPDRLADKDLWAKYEAVAAASGHNPVQPGQIDRAFGFVERWSKEGIDFDAVVIPTIKAAIAKSHDPTRTLGRFDAAIHHEHARHAATPKGGPYRAPESPDLEPEGEDPQFRPMRATLLERLGAVSYSNMLNRVRFESAEKVNGDLVLQIKDTGAGHANRLKDATCFSVVRNAARALGFVDVW